MPIALGSAGWSARRVSVGYRCGGARGSGPASAAGTGPKFPAMGARGSDEQWCQGPARVAQTPAACRSHYLSCKSEPWAPMPGRNSSLRTWGRCCANPKVDPLKAPTTLDYTKSLPTVATSTLPSRFGSVQLRPRLDADDAFRHEAHGGRHVLRPLLLAFPCTGRARHRPRELAHIQAGIGGQVMRLHERHHGAAVDAHGGDKQRTYSRFAHYCVACCVCVLFALLLLWLLMQNYQRYCWYHGVSLRWTFGCLLA